MKQTTDELIRDYLDDLDRELAGLPRAERREVMEDISAHIGELRADLPTESEANVRELLDRVGEPADIAADARERFGIQPRNRTWVEVTALMLLSIGSFTIVGWFVGVVLLWISEVWRTRDKLLGASAVCGSAHRRLAARPRSAWTQRARAARRIPQRCSGSSSSARSQLRASRPLFT
jgi:hypothetical protein